MSLYFILTSNVQYILMFHKSLFCFQNATSLTQFTGNLAISGEKEVLNWLGEKIEQAIIVSMEDKSWPMSEIA